MELCKAVERALAVPQPNALWPSLSPLPSLLHHAGTVIPPQDSVHAAAGVGAFKQRAGGQGLFVVGPFTGQLLGAAAAVQLVDGAGNVVLSS